MAKVSSVRGLKNYIQEIRNCTTKEAEKERIDKELGKIRKKYTSDKSLRAYDKRKYMWKLLYTHMLGYDVDFGHKQAMDLMAATGYAEKQVGYVVCSIFLTEKDELLRLVINTVRNDLLSRNETFQCLALDFIANVGGAEFASLLTGDVQSVLGNGATRPAVRKKAALTLLRLLRKAPPDANVLPAEQWGVRLAALLEERDLGVQLGLTTLLLGVVARSYVGFSPCVPRLVQTLSRCVARDVPQDYTYYGLASPWLQVRVLRALQYFPPPEDPTVRAELREALRACLSAGEPARNVNKANAVHAIAFEAVAVAVAGEEPELVGAGVSLLARFLAAREPNLRCLALGALARLAGSPGVAEAVARHARTVRDCLADPDASVARSALDLLFALCSRETARELVGTLLDSLSGSRPELREDLVLKAAVLAERFMPEPGWFVDVSLRLLAEAGEDAPADLWHSLVHVVTNGDEALHAHAAEAVAAYLAAPRPLPDAFLRPAAHILGEYAPIAALLRPGGGEGATYPTVGGGAPGSPGSGAAPLLTPAKAFRLLSARIPGAGDDARALFLTAARKLAAASPEDGALQAAVRDVLSRASRARDPDLQQRALEYLALDSEASKAALAPMPAWEERGSLLMRRLALANAADADEASAGPAWAQEDDADARPGSARAGAHGGAAAPIDLALGAATNGVAGPPPSRGASKEPADLLDLLDLSDATPTAPAARDPYGAPPAAAPFDPFATPAAAYAAPQGQVRGGYAAYPASGAGGGLGGEDPYAYPPQPLAQPQPQAYHSQGAPVAGSLAQQLPQAAAPQAPVAPQAGPPSRQASLAAGQGGAAAAATSPGSTQYAPAVPTGDVARWYARLLSSSSGILYEDAQLQVGVRLTSSGPTATLGLFLGNKTAGELRGVVLEVVRSPPGLRLALEAGAEGAPSVVEAGKQVRVPLAATALAGAPLLPRPAVRLAYSSPSTGRQLDVLLDLPIHAGRFATGVDVPPQVFAARWAQVPGPPHKLRVPLADGAAAAHALAAVAFLRPVADASAGPQAASAACVLALSSDAPRPVPCMVRVDPAETGGELAVAAADANAAQALLDALKVILA